MNLKDLIQLQHLNLSEPIVQWLSIANKKELYWSGESRGDWLVSVQKWLWKKQLEELKNVTYITIIADETCDVTVMEQLCICLRYFNPSTKELVERIICLYEIHSQTGEAIFDVINQFLFDLEKELDKKFILIGSKVPSASDTRWVYHYQLAEFVWTHMVSIVSALIQIHEKNKDGSETANGFAIRFVNEKFIFQIGIMRIILGHAKLFLKQTERRSTTFDKFSICLDSTIVRIQNTLNEFDYEIYKQKVKEGLDLYQ
ncbi:unnamed protein product [Rotaria sordida]|uniref:DUF4371 domain-containing protein n=2 Tax=Rotaria sordida TaxID=392033 RepID=A0A818QGZ1_9BILA|nr:unnamed protein product [Rotaria sordida]